VARTRKKDQEYKKKREEGRKVREIGKEEEKEESACTEERERQTGKERVRENIN
jgi:hypothetical protein